MGIDNPSGSVTINTGDIEIGAVEIKDGTTDTRAVVDATYGLATDVKRIAAGTAIIGKFGIDQTTDGTTNRTVAKISQTSGENLVGMAAINPTAQTATIANGASTSDTIDLAGRTLIGIRMPAAWTTANLTFQVVEDGVTTPVNFYDYTGAEVIVVATTSIFIRLNPADWLSVRSIIVRSGTSGTAVAQGAQRLITLVSKAV